MSAVARLGTAIDGSNSTRFLYKMVAGGEPGLACADHQRIKDV